MLPTGVCTGLVAISGPAINSLFWRETLGLFMTLARCSALLSLARTARTCTFFSGFVFRATVDGLEAHNPQISLARLPEHRAR